MANTIRAAKNTFGGGLVMDLAPDTTPNEVLTSALNATLVTFNGNELLLQNDMGNGRVETARLPEGYIPVGTCEFGDIIYIVSYNPLTNRSQIGCFPSPERNISTEEVGSNGQSLSCNDFLVMDGNSPTGELKANSVKKILYNNKLNPGDKFIIYDKEDSMMQSWTKITDIGNISNQFGSFPKYVKIHVIAIEDSGKINFLDSTLRWYGNNNKDYFITTSHLDATDRVPDIDSYRNLLSSGYSVFLSKISGKLALLIELEKITGFSCTYNIFGKDSTETSGIVKKNYEVFWNISWDTNDPNINPSYIVLTKSQWTGKDAEKAGKWFPWVLDNLYEGGYKLGSAENISAPPTAFYNYSNSPRTINNNYESWQISNGSDTIQGYLSTRASYLNFILNTSYDSVLGKFMDWLVDNNPYYEGITLTKLNVVRQGEYLLPTVGQYYINATKLNYSKDTNNPSQYLTTVYTQIPTDGKYLEILAVAIPDVIVNNYFHQPIYISYHTFAIPVELNITETINGESVTRTVKPDTTNLIYNYEITPAMPYGLLSEYAIEGYIDFSKVGSGSVDLNTWKYFIGENSCTLTIGMDAYVEDNMGIQAVVLEFYDNQGFVAAYHITDKESYSGLFTEVIPLNGAANTYKLLNIDANGDLQYHLGLAANEGDSPVYIFNSEADNGRGRIEESTWSNNTLTYLDDCGTIYSGMLYLVRMVVKYCPVNALGEFDTTATANYKYFHRWIWTTGMFNEYYHNVTDFDNIPLSLTLDIAPEYSTTSNYYYGTFGYNSPNTEPMSGSAQAYSFLSSNVQVITCDDDIDVSQIENNSSNSDGSGSGEGGSGGSEEEQQDPPFQQVGPIITTNTFSLEFPGNIITDIEESQIVAVYRPGDNNSQSRQLQYGIDYTISSGTGSSRFTMTFFGLGNTYTMEVIIPSGTISVGRNYMNNTVDRGYGFTNGSQNPS